MTKSQMVLLFGGSSDERRVSVATAQNLSRYLSADGWFEDAQGQIYLCDMETLRNHQRPFETDFKCSSSAAFANLSQALDSVPRETIFFLGYHGGDGENGTVQGLLERHQLKFTGSGSKASALAFDKNQAKQVAREHGVKICEGKDLQGSAQQVRKDLQTMRGSFGSLIVKPVAGGSSIGLFRVSDEKSLEEAVAGVVGQPGTLFMVEPFVVGREITVGVIQTKTELIALPPSEVKLEAGHDFDYQGKYLGVGSLEITPAEIEHRQTESVQKVARLMHEALGCYGYSRTDVILTESGPIYLETNTLPGLTKASFIPQQLEAARIPFGDFVEEQLWLASHR